MLRWEQWPAWLSIRWIIASSLPRTDRGRVRFVGLNDLVLGIAGGGFGLNSEAARGAAGKAHKQFVRAEEQRIYR